MLTRLWWRSLALPNLMLSYSTARSRITNTERAMPVRGCSYRDLARQALLPSPQLPRDLSGGRKHLRPFPPSPLHLPVLQLLPHPLWAQSFCTVSFPFQSFLGRVGPLNCGSEIRKSICLKKPGPRVKKPYTTAPSCSPSRRHKSIRTSR